MLSYVQNAVRWLALLNYVNTCTTNRHKYIAGSEVTLGSAGLVVRELERREWMDVDAF